MTAPSSRSFRALRQQRHSRWLTDLIGRLHSLVAMQATPADQHLEFLLFGSRARGDWDGYSDTDLLVVAPEQSVADRWADRLLEAGAAQDVLALNLSRWQTMQDSPSPYWRAVKSQAISLLSWRP